MRNFLVWTICILLTIGSKTVTKASSTSNILMDENDLDFLTPIESDELTGAISDYPRLFKSVGDIRLYLASLGLQRVLKNRNRFGKRAIVKLLNVGHSDQTPKSSHSTLGTKSYWRT